MEPTGVDALRDKGECARFTYVFSWVIVLLVKRAIYFFPNQRIGGYGPAELNSN